VGIRAHQAALSKPVVVTVLSFNEVFQIARCNLTRETRRLEVGSPIALGVSGDSELRVCGGGNDARQLRRSIPKKLRGMANMKSRPHTRWDVSS
jgi:hypothetical protein